MKGFLQANRDYGLDFDFPIWDANAKSIQEVEGHNVTEPDFQTKHGERLCVMIDNKAIYDEVREKFLPLGYKVHHGIRELFDAVRRDL
jgi:hypothetical protein